jgi:hypothetical protein
MDLSIFCPYQVSSSNGQPMARGGAVPLMRGRLLLVPLLLSLLTTLTADETPPLSVAPESPRPNRRYWRWEEFPPASLGEGCQPVDRWKATVKDDDARRVAEAVAELARLEMEAALSQCDDSIESLQASGDTCEKDGVASDAEVSCAGTSQGAADEDGAAWNCGLGLQRAVGASSTIDTMSLEPRPSAMCLVPEAQPGLETEPVEPLSCSQLVPASEEDGVWDCTELCVFRQCGYVCEYNEFTEEMKCAWDLQPCTVARECSTADLSSEDEGHSRSQCEAVPQGAGTTCVYTSGGAGTAHLICVVLFLGFVAMMLTSMVPLIGKPWWPPFQERGAALLLINAASSIIYAWATLVTDHHAPAWLLGGQTDARLWLGWLRLCFGFALWHSSLAVRLHAMGQLYLHDAEPLFWPIKLLQYMAPWLVLCYMTTVTDDPKLTISAGVILLSFFSFFHSMYLAAPLLKLRQTLPELPPTAAGVAAGLLNVCWIYIAIDQEADDGCSEIVPLPCAPSDAAAKAGGRRFMGTVLTILIMSAQWLLAVGPLLKEYIKNDPAFIEQFEPPPSKRQPDYAGPMEPEVPPEFEDEAEREARRLRVRGKDSDDEEGEEGEEGAGEGAAKQQQQRGGKGKGKIGASFSNLFAGATDKVGRRRFRKKKGELKGDDAAADSSDGKAPLPQLESGPLRTGEKLGF